jgi:hypothetical protein
MCILAQFLKNPLRSHHFPLFFYGDKQLNDTITHLWLTVRIMDNLHAVCIQQQVEGGGEDSASYNLRHQVLNMSFCLLIHQACDNMDM